MPLHKPKGVSLLSRSAGNIIRFDEKLKDRYKNNLATLLQGTILTKNEAEAIKHISVQPLHPDRDYITYQELQDALECKRESIVKRFLSLKNKGFVSFEDFDRTDASGENLARCKMVVLNAVTDLNDAVLTRQEALENSRTKAQRQSKNALREQILRENNLPPQAYIKPEELKSALMPKGFALFEKLAVDSGVRAKSSVTTFKSTGITTAVETTSIDDVFTIEDIQPLYCLVSITILSWYNCIEYFEAKQVLPPNRLYCEVFQIMKMLGKSGSGSYYPAIQASMARILGTEYKIINGEQIFEERLGGNREAMTLYKFFDPLKTRWHTKDKASIEFDERLGSERLKVDAYGYELTWEEGLYHTLLSEEAFFNIPLSILSARPLVFLLYINLRTRMARNNNEPLIFGIEDLYKILIASRGKTETKLSSFKESLYTDLKYYKAKNCDKGADLDTDTDSSSNFDLAGFKIKVHHSERRISALAAYLDHARLLKLSGASCTDTGMSISNPKKKAAPQSINKALDAIKRVATKLQDTGADNIPHDLTYRLANIKISTPKKFNGKLIYRHPNSINGTTVISAYSKDTEIVQLADLFVEDNDTLKSAAIFKKIKAKMETLPLLKIDDSEQSEELKPYVFNDVLEYLLTEKQTMVNTTELFDALYSCHTLREGITKKWTSKRNKDAFADKILEQIKPSSRTSNSPRSGSVYEN